MLTFRGQFERLLFVLGITILAACTSVDIQRPRPFPEGVTTQEILGRVQYQLDSQDRIIVPVSINGEGPFPFILDTAASRSVVYESIQRQLGIDLSEDLTTVVHGAVLSRERPVLYLDRLEVAGLRMNNVPSLSLPDLPSIEGNVQSAGVLGLDFLKNYAVHVDPKLNEIAFTTTGVDLPTERYTQASITFDDIGFLSTGLPFIEVSVARRKGFEGLLDLGAANSVMNSAAAYSLGIRLRRLTNDDFKFRGIFAEVPANARAAGAEIRIGQRTWSNQEIGIFNLPVFEILKRTETPAIVLSASLLREERFIIDFPAKLLFIRATPEQRRRQSGESCTIISNDGFCIGAYRTPLSSPITIIISENVQKENAFSLKQAQQ